MFLVAPDRTIKSSKLLACSRCRRIGIQLFRQEQRFSKPELKLAFYEFCYDVIRIILLEMPVGAVADKSGMIIHSFRVALTRFYNRFVWKQPAHGKTPRFFM